MKFKKEDLAETFYTWPATDLLFLGEPSRRSFDRYNGMQVLFIINFFAASKEDFTVEDGRMIEKKIHDQLPFGAKSEISVAHWLRDTELIEHG